MSKESASVKLARIEEKLSNLIEKVDTLCNHVNHELETINERIKILEDTNLIHKTQWRTLLFVASSTAGITVFIIKIVEFLSNLK